MPHTPDGHLKIFVCHAPANAGTADRLCATLRARRINTFRPDCDPLPGDQIIHTAEKRLGACDFFLLLWSRACADHRWVRDQWSAALTRAVLGERAFLFVMRLDNTPVPALLSARRQLDAFKDWDAAVAALLADWDRDRGLGLPVLPAPHAGPHPDRSVITLYLRNRSLRVSHVLAVPEFATGADLLGQVRTELALPTRISEFGDELGCLFDYTLLNDEVPLPDGGPLRRSGVRDGSVIDLEVSCRPFGPDGPAPSRVYRPTPDTPPTRAEHALLRRAFRHLLP
ncbi:toll/interleukin-1 receptor domain-containing protein [Spirillospora sp. CA-253888]